MDLQKVIAQKDWAAKYMIKEITYICKNLGKRNPGSEGELKGCEHMARVLRKDCGCEKVNIESFSEHPGAFYGWRYVTLSLALAAIVLYFFKPVVSIVLFALGLLVALLEFGFYIKAVDWMFPKKTGHSVYAVKKCKGEVKRRIIFNGHPDAAWEWPVNYKFGGAIFETHALICAAGVIYYLVLSIIHLSRNGFTAPAPSSVLGILGFCGMIFVPFLIGLYFMNNSFRVVDGANDNLTGCYMGIAILKALRDQGIDLENTEIGVLLTGSEEAGLRGAKAFCKNHPGIFDDVPTFIYAYDTIHDPKHLLVNYRDLNGTVKSDKDAADLFMEAANELKLPCRKGMVPPMGGATDAAAFAQGGMRAAGITGLNHKLENYYHTRRDTYDNMNSEGIANCFAISVKALEMFDNGAKQ